MLLCSVDSDADTMKLTGVKVTQPHPIELLQDPLRDVTRKERRNLLVSSAICVMVGPLKMVPTNVAVLGIQLQAPQQRMFVLLVGAAVAYFLVAFLIYGIADWLVWMKEYRDYREAKFRAYVTESQRDQELYEEQNELFPDSKLLDIAPTWVAFTRSAFDFLIPVAAGATSLYLIF